MADRGHGRRSFRERPIDFSKPMPVVKSQKDLQMTDDGQLMPKRRDEEDMGSDMLCNLEEDDVSLLCSPPIPGGNRGECTCLNLVFYHLPVTAGAEKIGVWSLSRTWRLFGSCRSSTKRNHGKAGARRTFRCRRSKKSKTTISMLRGTMSALFNIKSLSVRCGSR